MGLLGWTVLALVAGAVATALHDDERAAGTIGTLAIGIAGALLGGLAATLIAVDGIGSFLNLTTWLIAIATAFLTLVVCDALVRRRPPARRSRRIRGRA